ncbi:type 1 fimbrial major subunit FimA [Serratia sp. AKBS12]|uniref:type 1 fimbrial major subunit FimA n=1 Tax=Serratia sp. AKBS12 TaxID=2974597 RepID=UPI0021668F20|nr:type 1 fimbrial major subunit FimA [Serratia sp. AKBS12]MCS3407315.1 type 1 fimbrial major subunit FimA [Serratia sp. AKBS12]
MYKNLSRILIGTALLTTAASALAATTTTYGGNIHFTGRIVNAACAVSADSTDQTVNLGQYRTAKFTAAGDYSGKVPFTIKLEDCDTAVSTKASVAFNGPADKTDNTVLGVSNVAGGAAGVASGVGIELRDHLDNVLIPNGATYSAPFTLADGKNVLHFTARYKATAKTVTPGEADADATFTMQYQ